MNWIQVKILFAVCLLSVCTLHAQSQDTAASAADTVQNDQEVILEQPEFDRLPQIRSQLQAEYPDSLIAAGISGDVIMEALINEAGVVETLSVLEGLHPVLDSLALVAVKQWTYAPALIDSQPVAVLVQIAYRFSYEEVLEQIEQVQNVTGKLFERATRKPIAGATIIASFIDIESDTTLSVPPADYVARIGSFEGQRLDGEAILTQTDSTGSFTFTSLPACSVALRVLATGYESFTDTLRIGYATAVDVVYRLMPLDFGEFEITVYGQRKQREVARRTVEVVEVKRVPGFGGDAIKVVQALPGAARPAFTSGDILLRGTNTADSRFYFDGVEIPLLYHLGGLKSTINSEVLGALDVYPGGFGSRYGSAIGGIIEARSRKPRTERLHGTVDVSTLDASFILDGPITDKISFYASARRSYFGEIVEAITSNDAFNIPVTVIPSYWDAISRIDAQLNEKHLLSAKLFFSGDRFVVVVPSVTGGTSIFDEETDRLKQRYNFNLFQLSHEYTPQENISNTLTLSATYQDIYTSVFGFFGFNLLGWVGYFRNEFMYDFNAPLQLRAGIDANYSISDLYINLASDILGAQRDTLQDADVGIVGAYVNVEWEPLENLQIIPGARVDYYIGLKDVGSLVPEFWEYSDFNQDSFPPVEPSLRLTTRYEFIPGHTAKAAVGNYSQIPQPIGQVTSEEYGNPDLQASKAAHYVLGYEWRITDLIEFDVQGYYNHQFNLPRQLAQGDPPYLDDETGRVRGIELLLRHNRSERFFGWIAYTLSRSERFNPDSSRWELFEFDQTHNFQLVASWQLPRAWDFGLRFRAVSGSPTTPVIGAFFNSDANAYQPINGEPNSQRLEPFVQLDARVGKRYAFDLWQLYTYLDVQNISYFVYKSPEFTTYNFNYTEKTNVSSIPIVAAGITAEF